MFSFVMPARNSDRYVLAAVNSVILQADEDWELIVVDDNSNDQTYECVQAVTRRDSRVQVLHNPGRGKIDALNFGYSRVHGHTVKFIDSDDVVDSNVTRYGQMGQGEVLCHDCFVTDADLTPIGVMTVSRRFLRISWKDALFKLKTIPRCLWTMSRTIAEEIFPLPRHLPYEDAWMAFVIKKYARRIRYVPLPLYYYRQHEDQTYGGVLQYTQAKVQYRAVRNLSLIDVLGEQYLRLGINQSEIGRFNLVRAKLELMCAKDARLVRLLALPMCPAERVRMAVYMWVPQLVSLSMLVLSRLRLVILRLGSKRIQANNSRRADTSHIG